MAESLCCSPETITTLLIAYCCLVAKSYWTFFVIPWTITHQAPPSMGFPRQEYWSGVPFLPPGDLSTQGLKLHLPCLLHCRRILYPLSHQGSPSRCIHQSNEVYDLISIITNQMMIDLIYTYQITTVHT